MHAYKVNSKLRRISRIPIQVILMQLFGEEYSNINAKETASNFNSPSNINNQKEDGWDWDQDWDNSNNETPKSPELQKPKKSRDNSPWIKDCTLSLSRESKLMVIGHDTQLIFLHFHSSHEPDVQLIQEKHCDLGDSITQTLIVPFPSEGGEVSLCVVVGYKSGYIKTFSHAGTLIISQLLHRGPVQKLKLRTSPIFPGPIGRQLEDLTILYPGNIVAVIDGLSLYSILRAHILSHSTNDFRYQQLSSLTDDNNLSYRKWELRGQASVTDVITVSIPGRSPYGLFQPLASNSRIVAVGTEPMMAFYISGHEGSPFSTAVALASTVATKLTSVVVGFAKSWWGSAKPEQEQGPPPPKIENAVSLPSKWMLNDPQRTILSVTIDPTGQLAATTDSFGRVCLVDLAQGIIIRMWKGYRDAQCGWVQPEVSYEECSQEVRSFSMFLVIHAPKRGFIEIWRMKNGRREGFFNTGSGCQLLTTQTPLSSSLGAYQHARCFLLRPDGLLHEIVLGQTHTKLELEPQNVK